MTSNKSLSIQALVRITPISTMWPRAYGSVCFALAFVRIRRRGTAAASGRGMAWPDSVTTCVGLCVFFSYFVYNEKYLGAWNRKGSNGGAVVLLKFTIFTRPRPRPTLTSAAPFSNFLINSSFLATVMETRLRLKGLGSMFKVVVYNGKEWKPNKQNMMFAGVGWTGLFAVAAAT